MTTTAEPSIFVQVFKEGLLSRLGHDLRLSLRRFEVELADGKLTARFFPDSLVVDGAMRRGRLDTDALSDADREKIHRAICTEILFTSRHPEATLQADVREDPEGVRIEGNLTLVGTRRSLPDIVLQPVDDRLSAELVIVPSRWGIKPYRALGGALRLQDKLVVTLDFPAPSSAVTATEGEHTWVRRG